MIAIRMVLRSLSEVGTEWWAVFGKSGSNFLALTDKK